MTRAIRCCNEVRGFRGSAVLIPMSRNSEGRVVVLIVWVRDPWVRVVVRPGSGAPLTNVREEETKAEPGDDLTGRAAVVTGVGRGVGRAVALGLAQAGVRVGLVARSVAQLEQTARLINDVGARRWCCPRILVIRGSLPHCRGERW